MDITPAVIEAFREDFPGFADATGWPAPKVTRALKLADHETGSNRWGAYSDFSIKQRGMFNFAAHHLIVSSKSSMVTEVGEMPGSMAQVQSKTVGDESVTYALNMQGIKAGDEGLSATVYGQEFIRLRRRVGRGGSSSNAALRPGVIR